MEPVYLRALEMGDLDKIHRWRKDQEAYRTSNGGFRYESRAASEAWLREKQAISSEEVNLAVGLAETSEPIGTIHLTQMDWVARNAELQLISGEPVETSAAHEQAAVRLLTHYAMQDLGLVRLYAHILYSDDHSRRVFEELGWKLEVRLRHHAFVKGKFEDVAIMGLCAAHLDPSTG